MTKHGIKIALASFACVLAMGAFTLTGCSSVSVFSGEVIEETGSYKVTAENADENASVVTSGGLTIEDGDVLVVSPDLTKGELEVTLKNKSGDVVLDEEIDGRELDSYKIDPGTYDIVVTCKEGGTTGTLMVAAKDAKELEAQDQALEEALDEAKTEAEAEQD